MTTSTLLRLGFVGAGRNTLERHLPGFQTLSGVEFVAVANRTRSSAERVAASWNVSRVEPDWRAVVTARDIDAVCIGTWPSLHAEVTCAALAAGKHVLCEARMAADLGGAKGMLAASAAQPNLVAQLVPAPHTLAVDTLVRGALGKGLLGSLRSVKVVHQHGDFLDLSGPPSWRLQSRTSGVNMLSLGIFYEVLLRWLDADATVDSSQGMVRPARLRHIAADGPSAEIDLPESLTVNGHFPTLGNIPLSIHLSGITPGVPTLSITLHGEHGELRWNGITKKVTLTSPDGGMTVLSESIPDSWRVEADFVTSILNGLPVTRTDFTTGLRYMSFTNAAHRSLVWTHM
jgi:predicted dehydrogenase